MFFAVEGDCLHKTTTRRESVGGKQYNSSRMNTKNSLDPLSSYSNCSSV